MRNAEKNILHSYACTFPLPPASSFYFAVVDILDHTLVIFNDSAFFETNMSNSDLECCLLSVHRTEHKPNKKGIAKVDRTLYETNV